MAANADFKLQISYLQAELRKANDQLVATESDLRETSQDRQKVAAARDVLQSKLDEAHRELDK
jgi:predicted  nucleic acid-binding Zn-ribbon protein